MTHVYCPATADKLLQRRASAGIRGRSVSERARVQHTPKRTLCWLHLDADTFVSITNLTHHFSHWKSFQEYVIKLYRKTFHISPHLHDPLGYHILFDRLATDTPSAAMSFTFSQEPPTTLRRPSLPVFFSVSSRLPFSPVPSSSYQSGTSARNLVFVLHCSRVESSSATRLARSWLRVS